MVFFSSSDAGELDQRDGGVSLSLGTPVNYLHHGGVPSNSSTIVSNISITEAYAKSIDIVCDTLIK